MNETAATPHRKIPRSWAWARVADLGTLIRGVTYEKVHARPQMEPGLIGVLRATNVADEIFTDSLVYVPTSCVRPEQIVHGGDILIVSSSGSASVVGKAAPVRSNLGLAFGAFCAVLRPDARVAPYVAQYLRTTEYRSFASRVAAGVNINNLKRGHLEGVLVPVAPLQEQRRIVAEIEKQFTRLDEAVATLKAAQAKLKRARASVLKAAVEGRLVPTEAELARAEGRSYEPASVLLDRILAERRTRWPKGKKYQPPAEPKTDDLPELPEGWTWATIDMLSLLVTDGDHNPPKRHTSGIPHLTSKNVKGGALTLRGCSFVSDEGFAQTSSRYRPVGGDIIVTCVGTVGEVAVVPHGMVFSADRNLAAVRPVVPESARFVAHSASSPRLRRWFSAASGSTAQPHLYLKDLRVAAVAFPPLAEQTRIVAEAERRLSVIDNLEHTVEQNLARCGRLRQSILKRAFEGNLVPQDPSDEPASELLARIRAQRTNEARA